MAKKTDPKNGKAETESAAAEQEEQLQAQDMPITIHAQYVRDMSFENPDALNALRANAAQPQMDLNIGMDARPLNDEEIPHLYEVVLNIRAEAIRDNKVVFIAELQYGVAVSISDVVPEDSHHPLLFIEIPRLAFPYARQIMGEMTTNGGYPPLLLNPVDFHSLYLQRFGAEIEKARTEMEEHLKTNVQESLKD